MNKELIVLDSDEIIDSGVSRVDEKDLPILIGRQVEKLKKLDESVKKAISSADKARKSAERAERKSAGFGKKKAAIEELQSAGVDLASAVQSGAEAQKISFEFQTKLAEITKYLFGLGVSNIASNRFVVRELEMRLKGASKKELSDLARQELTLVVKQLKEQEDILRKQNDLSNSVKIHDERLEVQKQESQKLNEQFQIHSEIDKLQDEQIKIQAETDKILEKKLREQEEIDKIHNERLLMHSKTDEELKKQLEIQAETDKKLEEQLKIQAELDKLHNEQLAYLSQMDNALKQQIESILASIEVQNIKINTLNEEYFKLTKQLGSKANSTLSYITFALAIIALAASAINYFF
ncbi:MAG: hypothetical protein PHC69_08780 [Ruminiclostridium sp.]|nr:hypothetical protein [Ruminiclostridium sp.]